MFATSLFAYQINQDGDDYQLSSLIIILIISFDWLP